jgi:predicted metal-dependent hydrolase
MSDVFSDALERGVRLFNRGEFLDAHDVWAARWRDEQGDGADLLRGLVRIALGFSKLQDVDALLHALRRWRKGAEIALVGKGIELPSIRPAIPLAS